LLLTISCCFRFEEIVARLNEQPATTEEMDALDKFVLAVQQVRGLSTMGPWR
jgi:hypothetical protein